MLAFLKEVQKIQLLYHKSPKKHKLPANKQCYNGGVVAIF